MQSLCPRIRDTFFDTLETANTTTTLSAGIRNIDTAGVGKFRFIIRLTRNTASITAPDRVLVDNLRLLMMQP